MNQPRPDREIRLSRSQDSLRLCRNLPGTVGTCSLFPECVYYGDVKHSYIIELKHGKADASDAEFAEKAAEGIDQLHRYAADRCVPNLAGYNGTFMLHQ